MKSDELQICSFCGKSQEDVKLIVSAVNAHNICNECIELKAQDGARPIFYLDDFSIDNKNTK